MSVTRIPVTLYCTVLPPLDARTAVIVLSRPLHDHGAGPECPACAAASDIRAKLFDLHQERPDVAAVAVDVRALTDLTQTIDRLTGAAPAAALRDHAVSRRFAFTGIVGDVTSTE